MTDNKLIQYEKEIETLKDEITILKIKLKKYENIMSDFDVSDFDELRTIMEQGCGV